MKQKKDNIRYGKIRPNISIKFPLKKVVEFVYDKFANLNLTKLERRSLYI